MSVVLVAHHYRASTGGRKERGLDMAPFIMQAVPYLVNPNGGKTTSWDRFRAVGLANGLAATPRAKGIRA